MKNESREVIVYNLLNIPNGKRTTQNAINIYDNKRLHLFWGFQTPN
jgi:hypothetical protein